MVGQSLPLRAAARRVSELPFSTPVRSAASVAVFYLAWFGIVTSAGQGAPAWAIGIAAAGILALLALSHERGAFMRIATAAFVLGLLWENTAVLVGVLAFPHPGPQIGWAPAWMVCLWPLFGMVLPLLPEWMRTRPLAAAVLGGLGGPLSYLAGVRLGAASFPDPSFSLLTLAFAWAVLLPLLLAFQARGFPPIVAATKRREV